MNYIQTRLKRKLQDGSGYSEQCIWIPEKGTNGVKVAIGKFVYLKGDSDPWEVVGLDGPTQPDSYFQSKRTERIQRDATVQ